MKMGYYFETAQYTFMNLFNQKIRQNFRFVKYFQPTLKLGTKLRGVGTMGAKGQLPYQYFWIIVVKIPFCPTNIPGIQ